MQRENQHPERAPNPVALLLLDLPMVQGFKVDACRRNAQPENLPAAAARYLTQVHMRPKWRGARTLLQTQAQIQDKPRDLCLTVTAQDFVDLDDPIVNDIVVDLPAGRRKPHTDMEQHMHMEVERHQVEAKGTAARRLDNCRAPTAQQVGRGRPEFASNYCARDIINEAGTERAATTREALDIAMSAVTRRRHA